MRNEYLYNNMFIETNHQRNLTRGTFDKNKVLNTQPRYTDDRFKEAQTVFGKKGKGLDYVYSDRLWQWDYDKSEEATKIANANDLKSRTCLWYECYLSAYLDKEIEIKHILSGVNVSNGYPYYVLGYKNK